MTESPRPESSVLSVSGVAAGYGANVILTDVSLRVTARSIVAIVGANGAGKSTLMKVIYGIVKPTAGSVLFQSDAEGSRVDVTGWPPYRLTALGMNYVPQLNNVFPSMSVQENLVIGSGFDRKRFASRIEAVFNLYPDLKRRRRQRAETLSGGQRQMLALARALMADPALLLLDEPSAGVAPQLVDEMFMRVQEINEQGVAVLLVEQNARRSLEIADYAYVLESGRNRFEGTGLDLARDQRVEELYLGGAMSD